MSSNADAVAAMAQDFAFKYSAYAASAMFFYDYLITLDSEMNLFWRTKSAGPSIIFLLNRYLVFVVQLFGLTPVPPSFQESVTVTIVYNVFQAVQYLPWAAFSALRSYALCEGPYRWVISGTVFMLSSVYIILNLATFHWLSYINDPVFGTDVVNTISEKLRIGFAIAGWGGLIAADLIVLCVTWYRTYGIVKISRGMPGHSKRSLAGTLLRDGTLYFLLLLVLNSLSIMFNFTLDNNWGFLIIFSEPITAILTSRILINLQQVKRTLEGPSQSLPEESGLMFQSLDQSGAGSRIIGSLGGQLSFHGDDVEDWDEAS